jgi:hypothetical protein
MYLGYTYNFQKFPIASDKGSVMREKKVDLTPFYGILSDKRLSNAGYPV